MDRHRPGHGSGRSLTAVLAVVVLVLSFVPAAIAWYLAGKDDDQPRRRTTANEPQAKPSTDVIPPTRLTKFNHPDPGVIEHKGKIYVYGSDGSDTTPKIPVIEAESAAGPYTKQGLVLQKVPWANNAVGMSGPHVVHRGGDRFHMYFSAQAKGRGVRRCIGAAISTNGPTGPFVPRQEPLVCDHEHGGIVSPSTFTDPRTDKQYLLYKTQGPDARRVFLQELGSDWLTLVGDRTLLVKRTWNYEHPQLIYSAGKYFLFASVDKFRTAAYRTTVNWSESLRGPYPQKRARVMLSKDNTNVAGPGGAELIKLSNGQTVAFFHGWRQDGGGCNRPRFLYAATIDWGPEQDKPRLAKPKSGEGNC